MKKFIGDKAFYTMLFTLLLPMVIQQGITNFVTLLDNIMVGTLGTEELNSVAIINQLFLVFNLAVFGGVSGLSIFGAQFFGKKDMQGMAYALRVKLYFAVVCSALSIAIFCFFDAELISLFLDRANNTPEALARTLELAVSYIKIAIWGLIPFSIVQAYTSSLRETGDTVAPMKASLLAVALNLAGNYLLIFGNFGFPALGVAGAATATVISRWVELVYVLVYAHKNTDKYTFFADAYKSFYVPQDLLKKVAIVASPLLINEVLYALSGVFVAQNYATRGLVVVAANSINSTTWQLFCVIMFSMGAAVSILVGRHLGANDIQKAKDDANKLLFANIVIQIIVGLFIVGSAFIVPLLYNTEPEVRSLATQMMIVAGIALPFHSIAHTSYFVFRSGGKTIITFFFDCVYSMVVLVPISFYLCRYTSLPILQCYILVQTAECAKVLIAIPLFKSGFWAKNVVDNE